MMAAKAEVIGMGQLVDGVWQDDVSRTKDGHFIRPTPRFRNRVTRDGSKAPSGEDGFTAEAGRYHLYVSLACPWAHRTIIFRRLKRLESALSMTVVDPLMLERGWRFAGADALTGSEFLHEVYTAAAPDYTGRVTVPVLWDKRTRTIVNNESSEI